MRRWLLILVGSGWLLACLAVTGAWLIGRSPLNQPGRHPIYGRWLFQLGDSRALGSISVIIFHDSQTPAVSPPLQRNAVGRFEYTPQSLAWLDQQPYGSYRDWNGFGLNHDTNFVINSADCMVAVGSRTTLRIPYWAAQLMWAPVLLIGLLYWRRWRELRKRRKEGLCPMCGYDLRATPNRCPECGTEFSRRGSGSVTPDGGN